MPVVEIATFNANEAYLKDPLVCRKALETVRAAKGCRSLHYGLQVEDRKTGYLLMAWDTYEDRKRFQDGPEYSTVMAEAQKGFAEDPNFVMKHVTHADEHLPTESLTAPVTEIVEFHPQPDKLLEAKGHMAKLDEALHRSKAYPHIHGEIKEYANKWLAIIGWNSVEDHLEVVRAPDFKALLDALRTTTNISLKHVTLTKFVA